jgi:hypothetical protein
MTVAALDPKCWENKLPSWRCIPPGHGELHSVRYQFNLEASVDTQGSWQRQVCVFFRF